MIREQGVGHDFPAHYNLVDFVLPSNLDYPFYWTIATAWNDDMKKGETVRMYVPTRNYWKTLEKAPEIVAHHIKKRKAIAFHRKFVRELKEENLWRK